MTKLFLSVIALFTAICSFAQTYIPLHEGELTLNFNPDIFRQVYYFKYYSESDRLLELELPTPTAEVIVSTTEGDKTQSDIPAAVVRYNSTSSTCATCPVEAGETVYLTITLQTSDILLLPDLKSMTVSSYEYTPTGDIADININNPSFLTLGQNPETFLLEPVYVNFTAPQSGWLYLNFAPSITQLEYRRPDDDKFTYLKHEYLLDGSKTIGAKALLQVSKDEELTFKVSGFNPVLLSWSIENPEPGTTWDFPINIEPGQIELPAAAGDYFYRITPSEESFIQITSDSNIPGGYVQVSFDSNGTGSFYVDDFIHLRTLVYGRMEYLIHFNKPQASAEPQSVNIALTKPLECDDRFDGQPIEPGTTYATPSFMGTYYYRISIPQSGNHEISLTTLTQPQKANTRVNLYAIDDLGTTLARGLDLKYNAGAGSEYILQWTVFDVDNAIPFKVDLHLLTVSYRLKKYPHAPNIMIFRAVSSPIPDAA